MNSTADFNSTPYTFYGSFPDGKNPSSEIQAEFIDSLNDIALSTELSGPAVPVWGMSLRSAGSMRFRLNETNPVRGQYLKTLAGSGHVPVSVELIHSKTVYRHEDESVTVLGQGDGIITSNKKLIPVITVADCMPIFLYDREKQVFGVLHSGWKGTGIAVEALKLAAKEYGSRAEDFSVVLGPHIHDCCYKVDSARYEYFRDNFGASSAVVRNGEYFISLAQANYNIITDYGVKPENIMVRKECTCCDERFGSFRRETSFLPPDADLAARQKHFTVQAAWVKFC